MNSRDLLGALVGLVTGVAATLATFVSGSLDRIVKDREVDVEVMRIAYDILKLPRAQTGSNYRIWACRVLSQHTDQAIDCSTADTQNAVLSDLRIGGRDRGDPDLTDIGIYVCEESDEPLAQRVGWNLREANFGDIRLRYWNLFDEVPRQELSDKITIIFDTNHPEKDEVERIQAALSDPVFQPIQTMFNTGAPSNWFISVVVCDM